MNEKHFVPPSYVDSRRYLNSYIEIGRSRTQSQRRGIDCKDMLLVVARGHETTRRFGISSRAFVKIVLKKV